MLVALYRLYESRNDTFNIPYLLKILREESVLSEATIDLLENTYENEAKPLWIKVSILRNKAFGHRSITYTIEEVFEEAKVTPNELRKLLDITHRLLNNLRYSLDRSSYALNLGSRRDTLRLLDDLKEYMKWQQVSTKEV